MPWGPPFLPNFSLIAGHRECLSRACLPVSENSCAVPVERRLDQLVDGAHREDFALPHILVHYSVESVLLAAAAWHREDYVVVVNALDTCSIVSLKLVRLKRAHPNGNFDSFAFLTIGVACLVLHVSSFVL